MYLNAQQLKPSMSVDLSEFLEVLIPPAVVHTVSLMAEDQVLLDTSQGSHVLPGDWLVELVHDGGASWTSA